MFKRFRVQNFLCLRDVDVSLEPLTIFIGPNSSGKSAFFKALTTFSRLLWYPVRGGRTGDFTIEHGIALDEIVWQGDTALPIVFEVWLEDSQAADPDYTLELSRGYPGWSIVRERFRFGDDWVDTSRGFEFNTSESRRVWHGPYTAPLAYLTHNYRGDSIAGPYLRPIRELRGRLGRA